MTREQLDAIRARVEAGTARGLSTQIEIDRDGTTRWVNLGPYPCATHEDAAQVRDIVTFVHAAPADLRALLAEVERLTAEVESKTKQNVALIGQNGRLQLEVERLRGDRSEVNTAKLNDAFTEGTLAAADAWRPLIAAAFTRGTQAMRMAVLAEFERWYMAKESPVYFVRSLRVLSVPEATS